MAEHCLHEKDWGRLNEMIESHEKEIRGNGKPGLSHEVTVLSVKIETMNQSVKDLTTNVSALMKFQNDYSGGDKANKYNFEKWLKIAGFLLALFVAYQAWDKRMDKMETQINWINTPIEDKRGNIVLYPSGMIVDSLSRESDSIMNYKKKATK